MAMTPQRLPKSIFFSIAIFSFFAFIAVNLHASLSAPPQLVSKKELLQQKVEDAADQRERKLNVPDVTVLGRLFDLAQRFLPRY